MSGAGRRSVELDERSTEGRRTCGPPAVRTALGLRSSLLPLRRLRLLSPCLRTQSCADRACSACTWRRPRRSLLAQRRLVLRRVVVAGEGATWGRVDVPHAHDVACVVCTSSHSHGRQRLSCGRGIQRRARLLGAAQSIEGPKAAGLGRGERTMDHALMVRVAPVPAIRADLRAERYERDESGLVRVEREERVAARGPPWN